jgi:arylsulfatase A-like enzyme
MPSKWLHFDCSDSFWHVEDDKYMKVTFNILLAIFFILPLVEAQVKHGRPPNFIIIYSDDQRQDALGVNGNQAILTPSLDRLAKEAIRFTNANVVFALCSPSRAALLTGRYGSANGVLGLGSALTAGEKTIASYLKEAGYQTALSGKWHIKQHPSEVGFDFHTFFHGNGTYYNRLINDMGKEVKPSQHCDEYCVDRSIDFLKDAAQTDKPFFLLHCTQLPHMNGELEWDAKPETLEKYNAAAMPVPENRLDDLSTKPEYLRSVRNLTQAKNYGYPDKKAIQQHTKEYYAVTTEMDDALARLLKGIDALGLRQNTYIIFMSDNGWMLGDHGFTSKVLPYRPSTHVPLFILGPGLEPRTEDGIALNIDIAPTLMELAGIGIPKVMHGKSLVPILNNRSPEVRNAFVYEGLGDYGGTKPNLTVIGKQFRYIETYENESLTTVMFKELYDMNADPGEVNNLMTDPKKRKGLRAITAECESLIKEHKARILAKNN